MKSLLYFTLIFIAAQMLNAQSETEYNYDESKVPQFELPDILTTFTGNSIESPNDWVEERRPELYSFFEKQVYGKVPGDLEDISFKIVEEGNALGGKAKRKQIEVTLAKNGKSLTFMMLLYLPKDANNVPVFLGYNFKGNHTVNEDPNIIMTEAWVMNDESLEITDNRAKESSRGIRSSRWAIEKIVESRLGLATIYYGEVDPDKYDDNLAKKGDFTDGIHPLFLKEGKEHPKPDEWGSIAAWSFALSKALNYFSADTDVNENKVIAFGHSRLGKTSLWAGATDERFAGVISNDSGCGGAALSKRKFGETVGRINRVFPHWFCDNFNEFNDKEETLPVDQHQLLALIAPRPLYITSAKEDEWADPKGEFLSAYYASSVYELFEKKGISSDEMPEVNQSIQHTVAYHIRTGKHDVTDYDWEQYIKWADKFIR